MWGWFPHKKISINIKSEKYIRAISILTAACPMLKNEDSSAVFYWEKEWLEDRKITKGGCLFCKTRSTQTIYSTAKNSLCQNLYRMMEIENGSKRQEAITASNEMIYTWITF